MSGQAFAERARELLSRDASVEFTISRAALQTLLADSERYGKLSGAVVQSLLNARENLRSGGHTHDGRIVWEQVIAQFEHLSNDSGSDPQGEDAGTAAECASIAERPAEERASPKSPSPESTQ